ncbi:3-phosphoshikimate 1-carboxyvinyltransferase [Streptomyces galilaeus]
MTTDTTRGTKPLIARIPGSKSLTSRLLLLAAAAEGASRIHAPLAGEDTLTFRDALRACGIPVRVGPEDEYREVTGAGRGPTGRARLWCADAGTAARFLPPFAAAGRGSFLFDGSSQLRARPRQALYLSGLLMAAPLMRRYGARVTEGEDGDLRIEPGSYTATDTVVEPDASTASYVFAAAAVTGRTVTVPGLGVGSLQGDLCFAEILAKAGAEVRVDETATTVTGTGRLRGGFAVDMGDVSDTFMALAAIAPLADAPITIHGIGRTRLKESDLIAFSVLGLAAPDTPTLDDPHCVAKTFPGFHSELWHLFPWYELPVGAAESIEEDR